MTRKFQGKDQELFTRLLKIYIILTEQRNHYRRTKTCKYALQKCMYSSQHMWSKTLQTVILETWKGDRLQHPKLSNYSLANLSSIVTYRLWSCSLTRTKSQLPADVVLFAADQRRIGSMNGPQSGRSHEHAPDVVLGENSGKLPKFIKEHKVQPLLDTIQIHERARTVLDFDLLFALRLFSHCQSVSQSV